MDPKKASWKIIKSIPSLLLLMIRTLMSDMIDRLRERKQRRRELRWLRKNGNMKRKLREPMNQDPEKDSPEKLASPFPPEEKKTGSPSQKTTGGRSSDELAAAAKAELVELCGDAHEGAHALLQWKFPKLPDLTDRQKNRLGKQLEKNIERAGVKVAPGLGYGVALLATYAPLLKYMKPEPKPALKPAPEKEKTDDRDRGEAKDGKNNPPEMADPKVEG